MRILNLLSHEKVYQYLPFAPHFFGVHRMVSYLSRFSITVAKIRLYIFLGLFLVAGPYSLRAADTYILEINSTINPVVAQYLSSNLDKASREGADAVIIKMDTPGGLMESMRQIIKAMEAAKYPVLVYIGPPGARAASAGVFITMAADIAIMAEGTNIGAAHPVKMGGQKMSEDMAKKMTEDASAYIRALAEKHSRNAKWAQKAVTESVSITASEARAEDVVEYVVADFRQMREVLDGKVIEKGGRKFTLSLTGQLTERQMPVFKNFLNYLAHPNLAYIFLIVGIYGLIFEFSNPSIGFGAAVGGVSLMLAALALQIIPINVVGGMLIVFGTGLMVLDIWVPSYGILTSGGLVSFFMGSMTLIDVENFNVGISISLIIGATAVLGLFFVFAAGSGLKIQSKKVTTGPEGMIGLKGRVQKSLNPEGEVYVRGEIWQARTVDETLKKNIIIEVVQVKGNMLIVKKAEVNEV